MTGIELIAAERQRQIESEGYSASHDDSLRSEELPVSAACYALLEQSRYNPAVKDFLRQAEPHGSCKLKPSPDNPIRELTKAGYQIQALQPVDQFPHTYHIENIALLVR